MFRVDDYLIPVIIHPNHTAYKIVKKDRLNGFLVMAYIRQLETHEGPQPFGDLYSMQGRADALPTIVDGSTYWRQLWHEYISDMRGRYLYPYMPPTSRITSMATIKN